MNPGSIGRTERFRDFDALAARVGDGDGHHLRADWSGEKEKPINLHTHRGISAAFTKLFEYFKPGRRDFQRTSGGVAAFELAKKQYGEEAARYAFRPFCNPDGETATMFVKTSDLKGIKQALVDYKNAEAEVEKEENEAQKQNEITARKNAFATRLKLQLGKAAVREGAADEEINQQIKPKLKNLEEVQSQISHTEKQISDLEKQIESKKAQFDITLTAKEPENQLFLSYPIEYDHFWDQTMENVGPDESIVVDDGVSKLNDGREVHEADDGRKYVYKTKDQLGTMLDSMGKEGNGLLHEKEQLESHLEALETESKKISRDIRNDCWRVGLDSRSAKAYPDLKGFLAEDGDRSFLRVLKNNYLPPSGKNVLELQKNYEAAYDNKESAKSRRDKLKSDIKSTEDWISHNKVKYKWDKRLAEYRKPDFWQEGRVPSNYMEVFYKDPYPNGIYINSDIGRREKQVASLKIELQKAEKEVAAAIDHHRKAVAGYDTAIKELSPDMRKLMEMIDNDIDYASHSEVEEAAQLFAKVMTGTSVKAALPADLMGTIERAVAVSTTGLKKDREAEVREAEAAPLTAVFSSGTKTSWATTEPKKDWKAGGLQTIPEASEQEERYWDPKSIDTIPEEPELKESEDGDEPATLSQPEATNIRSGDQLQATSSSPIAAGAPRKETALPPMTSFGQGDNAVRPLKNHGLWEKSNKPTGLKDHVHVPIQGSGICLLTALGASRGMTTQQVLDKLNSVADGSQKGVLKQMFVDGATSKGIEYLDPSVVQLLAKAGFKFNIHNFDDNGKHQGTIDWNNQVQFFKDARVEIIHDDSPPVELFLAGEHFDLLMPKANLDQRTLQQLAGQYVAQGQISNPLS